MYWFSNFIPLIIQILVFLISFISGVNFNFDPTLYFMWYILIVPIYLLLVNNRYLKSNSISFGFSLICMLSVVCLRFLAFLFQHKLTAGEFVGDIPIGLLQIFILVPVIFIIISWIIIFLVRKKQYKPTV